MTIFRALRLPNPIERCTVRVEINGESREVAEAITLSALIESLSVETKVAACAVNMAVIKKDQWPSYQLAEGDRIELLQFVGGG